MIFFVFLKSSYFSFVFILFYFFIDFLNVSFDFAFFGSLINGIIENACYVCEFSLHNEQL